MSEFIGPALPPGLRSALSEEKEEETAAIGPDKSTSDACSIGPRLPPNLSTKSAGHGKQEPSKLDTAAASFCGPSLPSSSVTSVSDDEMPTMMPIASASTGSASYGPSLPPGFGIDGGGNREEEDEQPLTNSKTIGPSLPPGMTVADTSGDEGEEEEREVEVAGEEEDDVIGPMPMVGRVNEAESTIRRRREFESRSKAMKDKLLGKVHTSQCSIL